MRMKRSFLLGILVALFLFSAVSFTLLAQEKQPEGQASSETSDILLEGAKATWKADMTLAGELDTALGDVLPRLVIDQAATIWKANLETSQKLIGLAKKVTPRLLIEQAATTSILELSTSESLVEAGSTTTPRILVEHEATTALIQGLQGSSALFEATSETSPRILIEHAGTMQCYGLIPFHPSSPPDGKSLPVLWIVLGLISAAAVIVVLTKATW